MGRKVTVQPDRRPLKIYATDPTDGRRRRYRIDIDVANELSLEKGPRGDIVHVIDYDGHNDRMYQPVDLNEPAILMAGGLDPNESDPRFHQQMVYAVAMKVIETAASALGHSLTFEKRGYDRLRIFPHAFYGANAYFSPKLNAVLFGYFRANERNPGENIPGQMVYTCLSHDIIAHEVTHAIVHRLRPYFMEPSNLDVMAFHEGFSDIVALLQKFSFREILREYISSTQARLQDAEMMINLAKQFGQATGRGRALRSAIGDDNATLDKTSEPHARGAILVAAVFEGFFKTYERRVSDLIRIATGGTGVLQPGALPPDLVNRATEEAVQVSRAILRMCFRAFDYLPPVDLTFGDFLRALVTADFDLDPGDSFDMRHNLIEAFRKRGIMPKDVVSLAEESLLLDSLNAPDIPKPLLDKLHALVPDAIAARDATARRGRSRRQVLDRYAQNFVPELQDGDEAEDERYKGDSSSSMGPNKYELAHVYLRDNAKLLGLDPVRPIAVRSINPRLVTTRDGELLLQFVILATQSDTYSFQGMDIKVRGGVTLVIDAEGKVRYVFPKPLATAAAPWAKISGKQRMANLEAYAAGLVAADVYGSWNGANTERRFASMTDFAQLHGGH